VIGHGLKGSAAYAPAASPTCLACGASGTESCEYADPRLVANTEGPPDGEVHQAESDAGYFSLNGGILGIRIGDLAGNGPAQDILPGDAVRIHELDRTYVGSEASPACVPERYEVWIGPAPGVSTPMVQLIPIAFDPANVDTCGEAPAQGEMRGCGTTVFAVP
jgi:hypothetical protein